MLNNDIIHVSWFLKDVQLKKLYVKKLSQKIKLLIKAKKSNIRFINSPLTLCSTNYGFADKSHFIRYVIDISFSKTNTLMHITDHFANLKYFCSAGTIKQRGKNKRARYLILKEFHKMLLSKLSLLENEPLALHLRNVSFNKSWIIKKLKKRFFITLIRDFSIFPHNGCKKKKVNRKKFK